ncbi:MAG: di-trans,poly-cis-decaprenylcistransferase [Gemmatimonadota bacterium]|nr:di-trans,poly-cis-decaprenylcistransferase [Gemmatimonadota bacterium]
MHSHHLRPHAESHGSHASSLHVAIIMDGNGRWATARGLPRVAGHRAGADAVRRTVEAAPAQGIGTLTLYAFSSDNWRRPPREVAALMRLFRQHLRSEAAKLRENGVRLSIIGRRDRLALSVRTAIDTAEAATAGGTGLHLRVAIDYSARDLILRAASRMERCDDPPRERFAELLAEEYGDSGQAPDVDLLVRTGGEQRLSDFMLWEAAYAELHFTQRMWPEFDTSDLEHAVAEFHSRQRRFGAIPAAAAG